MVAKLSFLVYFLYHYTIIPFEFDPNKSASNAQKHGIDFVQAQVLWDDYDLIEIPVPMEDELRFVVIGLIKEKHWAAVTTLRGENIRIISVRRARKTEVMLYESERL